AVMIGIGTALADDPMLTARDCRNIRRKPKRVVLDTAGRLPRESRLVQTADKVPTIVYTRDPVRFAGTSILAEQCDLDGDRIDLEACLRHLHDTHGVSTLLSESGPRLLGALLEQGLVTEALVHIAPGVIGDDHAKPVAVGREVPHLEQMRRFRLIRMKQINNDIELHYRAGELPDSALDQNRS
ncbi:MAG: RibD family protein, partial [Phycisphaerales bacterium]